MKTSEAAPVPAGTALYLAVIQFAFVTCWTIYVIFLPGLLDSAGLPRRYAIYVLMLDQVVFMATDIAMGLAADRARRTLGRIGPLVLAATAVSCVAFLLLPHAAHAGDWAPAAMFLALLVWAATSSALRAPPWILLGRYAAAPSVPWLSALMLTGLAVGGAIAPYLGIVLKNVDPRLPFAVASVVLFATTAGLIRVERLLAGRPEAAGPPEPPTGSVVAGARLFLLGVLALGAAFQVHFSLNSAGQYLRYASAGELQYLMPVFWIGFNLAMFPGAAAAARYGALPVIAVAALGGAAGALGSAAAGSLDALIAAQLLAGGAWGCMLMAGFAAAVELGRTGREGFALGLLFAALALATLARMAAVAFGLAAPEAAAQALGFAPFVLWCAGAAIFAVLARSAYRSRPRSAA